MAWAAVKLLGGLGDESHQLPNKCSVTSRRQAMDGQLFSNGLMLSQRITAHRKITLPGGFRACWLAEQVCQVHAALVRLRCKASC